jgi:hypothetical protein
MAKKPSISGSEMVWHEWDALHLSASAVSASYDGDLMSSGELSSLSPTWTLPWSALDPRRVPSSMLRYGRICCEKPLWLVMSAIKGPSWPCVDRVLSSSINDIMSGSGGFYKYRCKYFYSHNCLEWVYQNGATCVRCLVSEHMTFIEPV